MQGSQTFTQHPASELRAALESMSTEEIDGLSFGVLRLDASDRVRLMSRVEAAQSGYGDRAALGLTFFTELAPCMAKPEIVAQVAKAKRAGAFDITFEQIGDFDDPDRELLVRMISTSDGGTWICIQRKL